jgi:hypothetical protein
MKVARPCPDHRVIDGNVGEGWNKKIAAAANLHSGGRGKSRTGAGENRACKCQLKYISCRFHF